jgi:nicotinate-nucleotide adenylyltransferase
MIGIFGSAFNPPTLGHMDAIKKCLKVTDTLFVMPSYNHPIKNNVLNFDTRILMTRAILSDCKLINKVILSSFEDNLSKKFKIDYISTYFLLDNFFETSGLSDKKDITFFVGSDNYNDFENIFKNGRYILDNFTVKEIKEDLDIRSTYIRRDIKKSKKLSKYTTKSVIDIINDRNLYQENLLN